jgi:hypothetical protein
VNAWGVLALPTLNAEFADFGRPFFNTTGADPWRCGGQRHAMMGQSTLSGAAHALIHMQQLHRRPHRLVNAQRRQFCRLATASAMSLGAVALPAHAQLFGRTAGLAPLLLGTGLPPPPPQAFELKGRKSLAQRVVLASFTLSFVQQHLRLVPAQGVALGVAKAATQFAELQLAGLDNAALQATTDTAYTAWLDAGRNAGLDMVAPQAMWASPSWPAVRESGQPSGGQQMARATVTRDFAPRDMVVSGIGQMPVESGLPLPSGGLADSLGRLKGQAQEFAVLARAASSGQAMEPLAEALNAQLMSVRLVLGFVEVTDELAGHPNLLITGDGGTRLGLYLDARNSQVVMSAPNREDSRTLTLRLPLMLPGPALKIVDSAQPDELNTSRAFAQELLGWRGATRTTRHLVQADSAAYAGQVVSALTLLAPTVFNAFVSS